MKLLISAILIFLFSFNNVTAQVVDTTVKYIWKNEETKFTAAIEINGLQSKKNNSIIYFLKEVDTVYNFHSDSLFEAFTNNSLLNCIIVKISFYNLGDSISEKKIKLFSDEFCNKIVPDFLQKFKLPPTANLIISGINNLAQVALYSTLKNYKKINKTALFLNSNISQSLLNIFNNEDYQHLFGKLFIYVKHENNIESFTDSLAVKLALASSGVIYKYDDFESRLPVNIFFDAYKWLIAEGNNYIIKTND